MRAHCTFARACASRFLLIRDIYIYLYASGIMNEIESLLQQSSIAQLVERLISMQEDPTLNLGLPSGFCSFKILNYNAAKCL